MVGENIRMWVEQERFEEMKSPLEESEGSCYRSGLVHKIVETPDVVRPQIPSLLKLEKPVAGAGYVFIDKEKLDESAE